MFFQLLINHPYAFIDTNDTHLADFTYFKANQCISLDKQETI